MTYDVQFAASAAKELDELDRPLRLRIQGAVELLAADPRPPGAKMLKGGERGRWRVRVGDYRVIYLVEDGALVVLVVRVAHRREVYG